MTRKRYTTEQIETLAAQGQTPAAHPSWLLIVACILGAVLMAAGILLATLP